MDYNNVQISKVDNGYIVSTTKSTNYRGETPETNVHVYKDFEDVIKSLSPVKLKLAGI